MKLKEIIFLGTGTSGGIPVVSCIVNKSCPVCHDSIVNGSKNRRRNTSLLMKFTLEDEDSDTFNLLLDCGKSFYEASIDWFPKYNVTHIDAVLLSHGHADAMLGLDDLRAWTNEGPIKVYLTPATLASVQHTFPYLLDISQVTGGGDVASLKFQQISETEPFTINGYSFTPLKVEHGKIGQTGKPFYSLGFRFDDIAYISDANKIPKETRLLMNDLKVFIVDALKWDSHSSHLSVHQAVREIQRCAAKRGYLLGMCHELEHQNLSMHLEDLLPDTVVQVAYDGMVIKPPNWGDSDLARRRRTGSLGLVEMIRSLSLGSDA